MKSWMAFWAALIGLMLLASWAEDAVGEETGSWIVSIAAVILIIGVFVARASHKARVEREVDALVAEHRDGVQGLFSEWFDANTSKHSDQFRIAEAAHAIMRVYGGRHVINELVNEGHQHVLFDDLADVFGEHRAGQIMGEAFAMANRPGFMGHLGAFGIGAFLGYKATSRR